MNPSRAFEPRYLRTENAADYVCLRPQTLRELRVRGGGPDFIRIAPNRVAYAIADLDAWLEARKRKNTVTIAAELKATVSEEAAEEPPKRSQKVPVAKPATVTP